MEHLSFAAIELHNHTTESDADFLPEELADYLLEHGILNFALTDHNATTGIPKIAKHIADIGSPQKLIHGYELTSYYGHILCWNLDQYIPWDDFFRADADTLLDRVHAQGGIVGIAHPMSAGSPISNGMRFEMKITDYSKLDFIEVINNAHPMIPDNRGGIDWWEKMYLSGLDIAASSGMDLHRPVKLEHTFTTTIFYPEGTHFPDESLQYAIKNLRTCVHRREIPAMSAGVECLKSGTNRLVVQFHGASDEDILAARQYIYVLKSKSEDRVIRAEQFPQEEKSFRCEIPTENETRFILEVYDKEVVPEKLMAIMPVI